MRFLKLAVTTKILQFIGNRCQESCTEAAIHNSVIVTHAEIHHVPDGNAVTERSLNHYRAFLNCTHRKNGYLRLVNNGSTHQAPKASHICKSECSTLRIIGP